MMNEPFEIVDVRPLTARRVGEVRTGSCTHCGQPATKEAHFKDDGFIIVERYCDSCIEPANFEKIMDLRSRIVLRTP